MKCKRFIHGLWPLEVAVYSIVALNVCIVLSAVNIIGCAIIKDHICSLGIINLVLNGGNESFWAQVNFNACVFLYRKSPECEHTLNLVSLYLSYHTSQGSGKDILTVDKFMSIYPLLKKNISTYNTQVSYISTVSKAFLFVNILATELFLRNFRADSRVHSEILKSNNTLGYKLTE